MEGSLKKLPRLDSNQDKQIQSLLCYRYTTGQYEYCVSLRVKFLMCGLL